MSEITNHTVDLASNSALSVTDPYALQADDVLNTLRTKLDGLSGAEAAERLKAVGPNRITARPKDGLLMRFLKQFNASLS